MSLLSVRTLFRKRSGRFDLVNADFSDNGANDYINEGQRMLDLSVIGPHSRARHPVPAVIGQLVVNVRDCISIENVWFSTGDGRVRLERKSEEWIRENYTDLFDDAILDLDPPVKNVTDDTDAMATPLYYAVRTMRPSPEIEQRAYRDQKSLSARWDMDGLVIGEYYKSLGIIIAPPPDEAGTFSIHGMFLSPRLSDDDDKSFWTEMYPEALVHAAMFRVEATMRNRQGMLDQVAAMKPIIDGLLAANIYQETAEYTEMEG